MSVLRIVRPVGLGTWGILGALLVSLLVTGGGIAPPHLGSGLAVASSGGCAGTSIPAAYTGAVTVDGGPLNASAAVRQIAATSRNEVEGITLRIFSPDDWDSTLILVSLLMARFNGGNRGCKRKRRAITADMVIRS